MIQAVLFDLDGTLLDTAHDLVAALNAVRTEDGLPIIAYEDIRNHVSQGAKAMISHAYNCDINSEFCNERWQRLVDFYGQNLNNHTVLFDGMDILLDNLEKNQIKWGIVTNKPAFLTAPLMRLLAFDTRTNCIVSGDTLPEKKPHPAPVLHACEILQCQPEKSVFIGDDERDIIAGRAAGTKTIAARYGYILSHDNPENWRADIDVNHPDEIWHWLQSQIKI